MDANGKFRMNCEQVEAVVLDLDREYSGESQDLAAALAHVSHCSRCAALQDSWEVAKEELRVLAEDTLDARAPVRVETRLTQEFRRVHRKATARRAGTAAAWALAAAAVAVASVGLWRAEEARRAQTGNQMVTAGKVSTSDAAIAAQDESSSNLAAELDDSSEFTPVPGAVVADADEGAILRVRMQRGSLGELGFPVNEQRAGEWIQVDLLVGNDGLPEAVRLAQEQN
jgi:hypothetical protein